MNLLRQLGKMLAGGGMSGTSGDRGLYYYVRCNRCGEVVQVRIDPMNDLSAAEGEDGLFARKIIVGRRCYNRMEAEFSFDSNRKLRDSRVSGGTFVDKDAYLEDQQKAAVKSGN
jgi:hypothetical protein